MKWGAVALLLGVLACGGGEDGGDNGDEGDPDTAEQSRHFFLPTGEADNTINPTVETDARGNLHMLYPAYAGGDAYYATCAGNCEDEREVKVVVLPTEGTVDNAMLALGADGKPRVLLSTYLRVYYGVCTGDCTQASGWSLSVILEHGSDQQVSGEAFALTADGRPRFLIHTYRAFVYGQKPPKTYYAQCDAQCLTPEGWRYDLIVEQIWEESTLRLDAQDRPRVATVARVSTEEGTVLVGAYVACDAACESAESWKPVPLQRAWSDPWYSEIDAAVSLALTRSGAPRVLLLAQTPEGQRALVYAECDAACTDAASWRGGFVNESDQLGAGLDLALDAQDRPRFVYTAAGNILLAHCDERCTAQDAPWKLAEVEMGEDMPADDIFLYPNCTVAAWFLRHPSLAMGKDDLPRVVYRAEDISGGMGNPDPTKPGCTAGADMTLTRYAQLAALE